MEYSKMATTSDNVVTNVNLGCGNDDDDNNNDNNNSNENRPKRLQRVNEATARRLAKVLRNRAQDFTAKATKTNAQEAPLLQTVRDFGAEFENFLTDNVELRAQQRRLTLLRKRVDEERRRIATFMVCRLRTTRVDQPAASPLRSNQRFYVQVRAVKQKRPLTTAVLLRLVEEQLGVEAASAIKLAAEQWRAATEYETMQTRMLPLKKQVKSRTPL